MNLIKEIKEVKPFELTLMFNKGEIMKINLEENIKEWAKTEKSIYKKLLNPDYFKKVKLQSEWGTIYWDNGIDFCPDVLYSLGKKIKKVSE